ncbi:MAG: hypothetical protein ACTSU4_10150 [Promethearchaeota archaeon]
MSLKEFSKEIFTRYGLNDQQIRIYLGYLRVPRATPSQVYLMFSEEDGIDYETVVETTNFLEEKGFLKKIEGAISGLNRYIPLEPYFELFVNESAGFREEIAKIKDDILIEQSTQFSRLDEVQQEKVGEIDSTVRTQISEFFKDADNKNAEVKNILKEKNDFFSATNKTIENKLHKNLENTHSELKGDIQGLDTELSSISETHKNSLKSLEQKLHEVKDLLNADLKNISKAFVEENEKEINSAKEGISNMVAEMLKDFNERTKDLEIELKKNLEEHVERHASIANELKPQMEQILDKYLERMEKIVTDLKKQISKLLKTHENQIQNFTNALETNLKAKIEKRHEILVEQTTNFKNTTLRLIDNLLEHANRFTDFSEDMAKKGFFWIGKKQKYKERNEGVIRDVLTYTKPMRESFTTECNEYMDQTRATNSELKNEISTTLSTENEKIFKETEQLNDDAQRSIEAQLEILATDMASEIDTTLQKGVKDCSDTTVKLKDSLESTLSQYNKQHGEEMRRHEETTLRHYTNFDKDIKIKNEDWVKDAGVKFSAGKKDVSNLVESIISDIDNFISKRKKVEEERLKKIRTDFDDSKAFVTENINSQITTWNEASADMESQLENLLNAHKTTCQENASTLQKQLTETIGSTINAEKDIFSDFNANFIKAINDATDIAETNEEKLKEIYRASAAIEEPTKITTWHTVGMKALISNIKDMIYRVKSSIIIVLPEVIPEILKFVSEIAYQKKAARFMLTSNFDLSVYGPILNKMKLLGNIQFRQLGTPGEYYAVTRDAEEVIIAPATKDEAQLISMVSTQESYAKLYAQFIGPIFTANSRPIR